MQGVQWMKVQLAEHDPHWHSEFEKVRSLLLQIWKENILDIQHVGSTSILGICAKPILDVGVVLRDLSAMDVAALEQHGYRYMGPRTPAQDRHLFILYVNKDGSEEVALHHIHCYPPGTEDFRLLVGFRDYLNTHPEEAQQYNFLKADLAQKYPHDRFAYSDGKRAFIERIHRILASSSQEE